MDIDKSEMIIYQTEDGQTKIEVTVEDETVWLSQAQMLELFQTLNKMLVYILEIFLKRENYKNIQLSRNT